LSKTDKNLLSEEKTMYSDDNDVLHSKQL